MALMSEDMTGNCRHYNVISSIVANESQGYLCLTLNSIDFSLKTLIYFVNDYLCVIHFGTKGLCMKWGHPV